MKSCGDEHLIHILTYIKIQFLFFQSKNLETLPILERRIKELAEENKQLHAEATELANEAKECEEKEEKLVGDAVKHLTEANVQINSLSRKFTTKTNESYKQKEEITHLLAQVSAKLFFITTCIIF